jgi:hypothetical protein
MERLERVAKERTFKELDSLRITNKTNFADMMKNKIITKEEFGLCVKEVNSEIKKKLLGEVV